MWIIVVVIIIVTVVIIILRCTTLLYNILLSRHLISRLTDTINRWKLRIIIGSHNRYNKYTVKLRIAMRNGIKVRHTDTQINVRITQAVISYSKLACDCNYHMRREKNWVQQENKDSEFLSSGVGVGLYIKVYDSDSRNEACQFGWACHQLATFDHWQSNTSWLELRPSEISVWTAFHFPLLQFPPCCLLL